LGNVKRWEDRGAPRFKKLEENDDFLDDFDKPHSKPFQRREPRERNTFGQRSDRFERKERGPSFKDRTPSQSKSKKEEVSDDFE
jgi:hypothetical protein